MSQLATVVYAFGILGLFVLDRDRKAKTSKALWLPVVWLLINGSRPVSVWLKIGPPASADLYLEGSPLDRSIYLALLAAGVIVLLGRQAAVVRFFRANPSIVLFVLYCAISISWSDYPGVAFKRWIKSISDLVMVLIVLTAPERSSAIRRLLTRAGFLLIPLSVLLIKYYPDMARYYSRWEGKQFVSGVAEDKNMLGMTCLVFGLGAVWRLLACRSQEGWERTRRLIAHGTILAMVLWLLWMSNSMTSLSCLILAGGLIAMTSVVRVARKPAVVHLMVATVACISFSVLFLDFGGGALETMGRNPTLTGRTEIWKALLHVGGNSLFGTGFESFWLGERLQKIWSMGGFLDGINESHNGYLEVYLNLGWIGVALLAVLIVTGYRNLVAAFRRDAEAGILRLGFFSAAIIYNFTEAAFKNMTPIWITFLLVIAAVPEGSIPKDQPPLDIYRFNKFANRQPKQAVAHPSG
jgi:O-antigen ligase